MAVHQLDEQIAQHSQICNHLKEEVGRVLVGQDHMLSRLLIGLLTGGHILLEGLPGLAKTLTIRSLATAIDTGFSRIQFTPDMLPSDVIGTEVFNPRESTYRGPQGPNLLESDSGRRNQPRTGQGPSGAAGSHAGASGDDWPGDVSAARNRSWCWRPRIRSSRKERIRCPRPRWTGSC